MDIYNLQGTEEKTDLILEKLEVIYHNNPTHMKVVKQLQNILSEMEILEYFSFQGFDDINEMEGQLIGNNYDLLISSINMGAYQ